MSLEDVEAKYPSLLHIVRTKVKPEREALKDTPDGKRLKRYWWRYCRTRPELYAALAVSRHAIVAGSQASAHFCFGVLEPRGIVFSSNLTVIPCQSLSQLAVAHSRIHEIWSRNFMTTLKDDLVYTPTTCFETFPFPAALLDTNANDPAHESTRQSLEAIGERYHQFRAELMIANNEGLTSTYNRFHDPSETSPAHLQLRELHTAMDQAVLQAYGWSDINELVANNSPCGFGLDYLDLEDDAQLPDALQDRIGAGSEKSGDLFFHDPNDALDFQGQLRANGAVKSSRRLPWRYRWPDAVRDEVLARLLALNAERYEEEVRLGLHSKAARQAAKAATSAGGAAGKRRGRPAKNAQAGEAGGQQTAGQQTENQSTEQMGLGL
jgi:hypothetical protein